MNDMSRYFGESSSRVCGTCDRCQPLHIDQQAILERAERLAASRTQIGLQHAINPLMVLTDTQLQLLSILDPTSIDELERIPTFGDQWIARWGKHFLEQS